MTDGQIQAKAIICAALIQSPAFDPNTLASPNRSISDHKLAHLKELTDHIYEVVIGGQSQIPSEVHN